MLSSPPLLLFLVLALVSGVSTFTLLLLPVLPSLPSHLNPFHSTLPRTAFSNLSPRTSSPRTSNTRSIAIFLAAVELVVVCLGCWQELLLWSGKGATDDSIGQGARMGLAMVLRPVAWTSVSLYLFLRRPTNSSSSSTSIRAKRRKTLQLAAIRSGLVLLLAAVFAGASSASIQAAYGIALVSGLLLMLLGTMMSGWQVTRVLSSGVSWKRTSRSWRGRKLGEREKAEFVQGEWRDEKEEQDRPPSREDLLKREVSRSRSRGPGWGEGGSWLSSPDITSVSLPPFDLSLPSTTHRSVTPFDSGRPVTPHDFSRPVTPYDTTLPIPPVSPRESSWISEPSHPGSTMSSFSFPASLASNVTKFDKQELESSPTAPVDIDIQPASPSQESIFYNPNPYASAMPTPLTPGFSRNSAYSATTARSSSAIHLTLSPPPSIPLPPTPTPARPPPSSYTYNAERSSLDRRPSTTQERSSTDWAASTQANTSVFRPSTEMYGTTAYYSSRMGSDDLIRASGDEPVNEQSRRVSKYAGRTEDWARLGLGKEELNSLDELEEKERQKKRAWLGVACVSCAWVVFALSMPSTLDCIINAFSTAPSAITLCLILSLTLSSPITLVLYLLSRLSSLTSPATFSPAPSHRDRAPNRQTSEVYSALSFCDGPIRPSSKAMMLSKSVKGGYIESGIESRRKSSGLRPLSLVMAKDRMEKAEMVGRCLSPNEEGMMGGQWIDEGHAKPAGASKFSRTVSFLRPNPLLQQLPFSVDLPTPPPRAASPSSSFASSTHSVSVNSSQLSAILDQGIENHEDQEEGVDETFRSFRERINSGVSDKENAQILTAQRARGSVGRLVDLMESPRQVEFMQTVGEFGEKHAKTKVDGSWNIDWLSAGLLSGLVPSIRIGTGISVGPQPSKSNHRSSPEPTSILRQTSAYDRYQASPTDGLSQACRPRPRPHSTSFAPATSFSSHQSSIPYDPADRASGAKAPTPGSSLSSHGRSSSIETAGGLSNVHKRSFSNLFNSPSFLSSTPHRQGGERLTQSTQERRPEQTPRSRHKAYHSLPMLAGVVDEAWGDELRGELNQFEMLRSPTKKALPTYDADVEAARAAGLRQKGTFGQWKVSNAPSEPLLVEEEESEEENFEEQSEEDEITITITSFDFSAAQATNGWDQGLAEPTFIIQDQSLSPGHRYLPAGSAFPVPEERETTDEILNEIMMKLQGRPQSQTYSINDDNLMGDYDEDEAEGSVSSLPTSSNMAEIPDSYDHVDVEVRDQQPQEAQRFSMASSHISFHMPLGLQRPASQASFASGTTDASSFLSSPSPSPLPSHRAGSALDFSHQPPLKSDNNSYPLGRPSFSLSGLLRPGSSVSGAIRPESRQISSRPESRQTSRSNSRLSVYSSPSEPYLPSSFRPSARASLRAEPPLPAASRTSSRASSNKPRSILADRSANVGSASAVEASERPGKKGGGKGGVVKRRSMLTKQQEPVLAPAARYKVKGSNFGGLVREDSKGHIRVFKPKPIR